ncbi:MAG: FtsX-like permease family protein [bacterium]|nr:FtsX-like permease family protein [bacterium]
MKLLLKINEIKLIARISLRNLFRQRRRNILLGIAIAFGMMILVLANSFSNGITDNLFNRLIVYATGHIEVLATEKGRFNTSITRDKERIENIIKKKIKDMRFINESIVAFTRAIGNGKAESVIVVGIDLSNDNDPGSVKWEIVKGNIADFTNGKVEFPYMVHEEKAKDLNIKIGDTVKVRLSTIYGQQQTARLTLVAIAKSAGVFQSMATYLPFHKLKALLGYKPWESGSLQVILKDPKTSIFQANNLYQALKPDLAIIFGELRSVTSFSPATALSFYKERSLVTLLTNKVKSLQGNFQNVTNEKRIAVSTDLARSLNVSVNDKVQYVFKNKFGGGSTTNSFTIKSVFDPKGVLDKKTVLLNENDLYDIYYKKALPDDYRNYKEAFVPSTNCPVYASLATEWRLLPRSRDNASMEKKYSDLSKSKWKGIALDVRTMYETASQVVQLEVALNIITFVAVLILFFIILIGVVNTMRMSIRERTREIGTIRAIGMQKKDVRNIFIMETFFLSFFASLAGVVAGFLVMGFLYLFRFSTASAMSILLVDRHLYFVPTVGMILFDIIIILLISVVTAYFPSRRAANLTAAQALRHYE